MRWSGFWLVPVVTLIAAFAFAKPQHAKTDEAAKPQVLSDAQRGVSKGQ